PELFASLRPVAYSGSLEGRERALARDGEGGVPPPPTAPPGAATGFGAFGGRGPATYSGKGKEADKKDGKPGEYSPESGRRLAERLDLGKSVASAASAARLGDFFQYAVDKPVSLPRQKSALLPIVGKDVQAKRVSIYREATHAKFPLLGLRLKNTSGLHLMQGPITVFEGSNYAGDARVEDLQPNEERLISYAVDLGTEVSPKPSTDSGRVTHVKAVKGILWTTNKVKDSKVYTVKNRNDAERVLLVEHPVRTDFKLVGDAKPAETASDVYRFELKVPAGGSK